MDCGDKHPRPPFAASLLMYDLPVSGPVVDRAGREIGRRGKQAENSQGKASPEVVHCRGWLKGGRVRRRKGPRPVGIAEMPFGGVDGVSCAVVSSAAPVEPVRPGLDPRRSTATLNKGQGQDTLPLEGQPSSRARDPETARSRGAEMIVPNGREARHRTGRRGSQRLRLSCFCRCRTSIMLRPRRSREVRCAPPLGRS